MFIDLEQIFSHINNSHEAVDVADIGGVLGSYFLLREQHLHLPLCGRALIVDYHNVI